LDHFFLHFFPFLGCCNVAVFPGSLAFVLSTPTSLLTNHSLWSSCSLFLSLTGPPCFLPCFDRPSCLSYCRLRSRPPFPIFQPISSQAGRHVHSSHWHFPSFFFLSSSKPCRLSATPERRPFSRPCVSLLAFSLPSPNCAIRDLFAHLILSISFFSLPLFIFC